MPFWELPIPPLTGRQEIRDQVDAFRQMRRAAVKANETTLMTGRPSDQIHDVRGNATMMCFRRGDRRLRLPPSLWFPVPGSARSVARALLRLMSC